MGRAVHARTGTRLAILDKGVTKALLFEEAAQQGESSFPCLQAAHACMLAMRLHACKHMLHATGHCMQPHATWTLQPCMHAAVQAGTYM